MLSTLPLYSILLRSITTHLGSEEAVLACHFGRTLEKISRQYVGPESRRVL